MLGIKQKIRFVLQKILCYTITIVINLTLNIQKSLLYFFQAEMLLDVFSLLADIAAGRR